MAFRGGLGFEGLGLREVLGQRQKLLVEMSLATGLPITIPACCLSMARASRIGQ